VPRSSHLLCVDIFQDYIPSNYNRYRVGRDREGNGRGISRNLPGGSEENHKKTSG
jgi:hypothetical protein